MPSPFFDATPASSIPDGAEDEASSIPSATISRDDPPTSSSTAHSAASSEIIPEYTIVYGSENKRRTWSGEGAGQAKALHVKHLDYLREILVRQSPYFSRDVSLISEHTAKI